MIQTRHATEAQPAQLFLTNRNESNGLMYNGNSIRFQQNKMHIDRYYFNTTPQQMMTFDNVNSKVGINTTSPTTDFEVNDLKITGSLIDASGNTYANLNAAFVDTNNGVELELFNGAITTNRLYNDNGVFI